MVTIVGRDPAWTNSAMSALWAHATKLNLSPIRWEIGLFNLRDLIEGRDKHFRGRDWRTVRLETVWGCTIHVISLADGIALVAHDAGKTGDDAYQRFVAGA